MHTFMIIAVAACGFLFGFFLMEKTEGLRKRLYDWVTKKK